MCRVYDICTIESFVPIQLIFIVNDETTDFV